MRYLSSCLPPSARSALAKGGIPFIPLAVSVIMGMGYDRMTGFATAAGGLAVGFTAGAVNFYTTGVAR